MAGPPWRPLGVRLPAAWQWLRCADSPIKDAQGHDREAHHLVFDRRLHQPQHRARPGKELGIKAAPTSTGGMPATLTAVMSGRIDIGWGSPPFGLREIEDEIIATAFSVLEFCRAHI
jgi:hypothetical protein